MATACRKFTWFGLFFPGVVAAVERMATHLKLTTPMPSYTSEETKSVINKAVSALVSGKETTAAALASEKVAIKNLEEALAIVEPLKASNSALQTLSTNLQGQLESAQGRLAEWEAQDAAEDEALAPLDAFLKAQDNPPTDPVTPPTQPETPEVPETPVDDTPPPSDPVENEVPATDGVDQTLPPSEPQPEPGNESESESKDY